MKKDYSYKDSSRLPSFAQEPDERPSYGSSKFGRDSWTDQRVEEIKRKYDTPSHRKNISQASQHERSRDNIIDSTVPSKYLLKDSSNYANRAETFQGRYDEHNAPKFTMREEDSMWPPSFNGECKENSSLIEKFSHIKSCLKSEFSKNNQKEYLNYREYPQTKLDPRVQNIDKINSKIKKILNCLHDNENYLRKKPDHSLLKGSIVSRGNHSDKEELEETKIISRQRVAGRDPMSNSVLESYGKDLSFSPKNRAKFESETQLEEKNPPKGHVPQMREKLDSQYNSPYKILDSRTNQDTWFAENKQEHNRNRARSCLGDFKNDDYRLSSGKKLDDEITRTADRIRALEEEKKKLNIQFKPFQYEGRANRSTSNLNSKTHRNSKPPLPRMKTSEFSGQAVRRNFDDKSKTEVNEEYEPRREVKSSLFMESDFKRIDVSSSSSFLIEKRNFNSEQSVEKSARFAGEKSRDEDSVSQGDPAVRLVEDLNDDMKQHAQEGIENRKRKLLETVTDSFARETKSLIENLFEQVKLDEEFRNAKIWLRDLYQANKWEALEKVVSEKGGVEKKESLQRLFEVTEEEDNPFFSTRDGQIGMQEAVSAWRRSEKHWSQQILHCFNVKEFEEEKFSCEKVDLERKGYFTVEDLVRFLNMETGTFYRNRDLILVFKRFTQGTRLEWEEFMGVLGRDH